MLKELYDRIQETAQPQAVEVGGVTYLVSQNGEISEFTPQGHPPGHAAAEQLRRFGAVGQDRVSLSAGRGPHRPVHHDSRPPDGPVLRPS